MGPRSVRLFRYCLGIYIYMLVLLPSGSILGFNVKIVWFFALLPGAFLLYFGRGRATLSRTLLLLLIPAIMLFWFLLAQWNGFELASSLAHYKDLIVTICSCWFAALLCAEGYDESIRFLHTVIRAEVAASLLKVLLLAYALLRGVSVTEVSLWIKNIFGVSLMTYDFESTLGRIQFISDGIIPICIFAILCFRQRLRIGSALAHGMLLLLLASDFFAFSRYLWVFTVLAIVLGLLLGERSLFQVTVMVGVGLVTLVCLPLLVTVISLRFSSTVVDSSDQDRVQQVTALKDFWASEPVIGHGLGSYTRRVIRKDDAPYSYEMQLLALCGQIGVLGMVGMTALGLYYFRSLWPWKRLGAMHGLGLSLLLSAWIGSGVVNPAIISSAASVSYAAIFAIIEARRALAPPCTDSLARA